MQRCSVERNDYRGRSIYRALICGNYCHGYEYGAELMSFAESLAQRDELD